MKKKILMVLLTVSVIAMTFTGCGNKDEADNETVTPTQDETTQDETTQDETTTDEPETTTPDPGIDIIDDTSTEAGDSESLGANPNEDAINITEGGVTTGVDEEQIAVLDASTPIEYANTDFGSFAYPSVGETNEYMLKVYNSKVIGVNDYTGTSIYKTDDGKWVFIFYGNREGATRTVHLGFNDEGTDSDYTDDDVKRMSDNGYLYRDMANAGEFLDPLDLDDDGSISFAEAIFAAMLTWDSDIEYNGVLYIK